MYKIAKTFIANLVEKFIEIVFPEFCIGCKKIGTLLCSNCYEQLEYTQFKINKKKLTNDLDTISCCCYYSEISKKIITELKYRGVIAVGKVIAHILFYSTSIPNTDLITFVPIHQKKLSLRGFNQTEIIAMELSRLTNIPVATLLIKTKHTVSQMSQNLIIDRQKNIVNTIMVNPSIPYSFTLKNKSIMIIDDVFTTGTTISYCAKILKSFGFEKVHGVCFAYKN